jgi:hydroxymethylpyrimidine/phosphomethylpyrimidine kinase
MEARVEAATRLLQLGAALVCLKGGHGFEDPVKDLVLAAGKQPAWAEHPRLAGRSLHGTGCRFAAALATLLATGRGPLEAAQEAGTWVAGLLAREGSTLGAGSKPR